MDNLSKSTASPVSDPTIGALYALLAYGSWGLLPIYWKQFGQIPALEILSHRVLWSMLFLTGLLLLQHRRQEFFQLWRSRRPILLLLTTAVLLSFNWGLYIYGVNSDRVVETSLGYFINPLVTVMLGCIVLREKLNRSQIAAVALAAFGVSLFVARLGQVPWIALGLAFSFATYSLLRKLAAVTPTVGLAVETLFMTPIALLMVSYWQVNQTGHLTSSWTVALLFIGSGIATSLPLLWFNNAARRLQLSTLGFLQYLAPSIQLVLGVFLYQEPFTHTHLISFSCIWLALAIFSSSSLLRRS